MPKTLLAVDDSVTMRKALEITFSSDDFKVIAAENTQAALAKVGEADAIVIDAALGGEDGYGLAQRLRAQKPGAAIIILASRYNPYDQARGKEAGADDFADKPFDTQALLDKVKKAIEARASGGGVAAAPPPQAAGAPYRAPAPPVPAPAPSPMPTATAGGGKATQQSLGDARVQAMSQPRPAAPPAPGSAPQVARPAAPAAPQAAPPRPPPVAAAPPPPPPPPPPPAPAAVVAVAHAATNGGGQLAGKLAGLGLTPAQVDGVLALSREVVEQVVWEVVPQLAETLIKEEIARLTRE